jgi:hypothetical protein
MALTGALCVALTASVGSPNKSLRASVRSLLGQPHSRTHMTYDLRRLRLKGLIARVPHTKTYTLTPEGIRAAVFYTKLDHRLLHPYGQPNPPPATPQLRSALKTTDHAVLDYIHDARLALAA